MRPPTTDTVEALLPLEGDPPVKPRLRGHLHQWAFVASIVLGIVLISIADGGRPRVAATVYSISLCLLFGTSALYHRRNWRPRARTVMRRLDHSMILVLIAGTYTPIALLGLPRSTGRAVLWVVWVGALVGIAIRMLWLRAPTWAIIPPYLVVGWVAVFVLPSIVRHAGVATLVLLLVGGVLYTLGALIFASRWPRLSPRVFGYHELFHLLTLVAGAVFYIANSLIVYRA